MANPKFRTRFLLIAALSTVFVVTAIYAQNADETATPTTADHTAARTAKSRHHALPANTPRGRTLRATPELRSHASASVAAESSGRSQTRYPADLRYHGGAVLDSVQSHAIYLRPNGVCPLAPCWGNPEKFLRDLGKSDLIHTVDQYVGLRGDHRYTVGQHAFINFKPNGKPLIDDDVLGFVHAVASKTGQTGYGHIYHVFLPPGTDECFDSSFTVCYSPDNNDTFFFCAYHGSADFSDIGHVIYSVEPSQNTPGCRDLETPNGPLPNGILIDSTNDTLSHELIEAITDPDLDAWWNELGLALFGQEIADECIFLDGPAIFRVENRKYAAQTEYSNAEHGCVTGP